MDFAIGLNNIFNSIHMFFFINDKNITFLYQQKTIPYCRFKATNICTYIINYNYNIWSFCLTIKFSIKRSGFWVIIFFFNVLYDARSRFYLYWQSTTGNKSCQLSPIVFGMPMEIYFYRYFIHPEKHIQNVFSLYRNHARKQNSYTRH